MSKRVHVLLVLICILFYTWLPHLLEDVIKTSFEVKVFCCFVYVAFLVFCLWMLFRYGGKDPKPFYPDEV